ncbi:hypothetical protein Hanom_Chr06g00485011 [Helianthus anomalus]
MKIKRINRSNENKNMIDLFTLDLNCNMTNVILLVNIPNHLIEHHISIRSRPDSYMTS